MKVYVPALWRIANLRGMVPDITVVSGCIFCEFKYL